MKVKCPTKSCRKIIKAAKGQKVKCECGAVANWINDDIVVYYGANHKFQQQIAIPK